MEGRISRKKSYCVLFTVTSSFDLKKAVASLSRWPRPVPSFVSGAKVIADAVSYDEVILDLVAPKSSNSGLIKVRTEAQTHWEKVMWRSQMLEKCICELSKAKDHQLSPKAGISISSPQASTRSQSCHIFCFQTLSLQTCETINSS